MQTETRLQAKLCMDIASDYLSTTRTKSKSPLKSSIIHTLHMPVRCAAAASPALLQAMTGILYTLSTL